MLVNGMMSLLILKRENGSFDDDMLLNVLMGANYMENKPLMDLACHKVRKCVEGKTPEQIREEFNICSDCRVLDEDDKDMCKHGKRKNAFSKEEEEELRRIKPYEEWQRELKEEEAKKLKEEKN